MTINLQKMVKAITPKVGDMMVINMNANRWQVTFTGVLTTEPYFHLDGEISADFSIVTIVRINTKNPNSPVEIEHHAELFNVYFGDARSVAKIMGRKM